MGDRSDLHRTRSRGVRKLAPNINKINIIDYEYDQHDNNSRSVRDTCSTYPE